MKLTHNHSDEGPPCRHMEGLLHQAADGSAKGVSRWYAFSHAARCGRCGRFLDRLTETIKQLRKAREEEPTPEALSRLAQGKWRSAADKNEEPQD